MRKGFEERLHPRGRKGQWVKKLSGLKVGGSVTLASTPHGPLVATRTSKGFRLSDPYHGDSEHSTATGTAQSAASQASYFGNELGKASPATGGPKFTVKPGTGEGHSVVHADGEPIGSVQKRVQRYNLKTVTVSTQHHAEHRGEKVGSFSRRQEAVDAIVAKERERRGLGADPLVVARQEAQQRLDYARETRKIWGSKERGLQREWQRATPAQKDSARGRWKAASDRLHELDREISRHQESIRQIKKGVLPKESHPTSLYRERKARERVFAALQKPGADEKSLRARLQNLDKRIAQDPRTVAQKQRIMSMMTGKASLPTGKAAYEQMKATAEALGIPWDDAEMRKKMGVELGHANVAPLAHGATPHAGSAGSPKQGTDDGVVTFTKSAGGTNGAMLGTDSAGNTWVVKSYKGNVDRVATELLANAVYRKLGVKVPEAGQKDVNGKPAIAYKAVPGVAGSYSLKVGKPSPALGKGFMADALLANWDVVGLEHDNLLWPEGTTQEQINSGNLEPTRLDQGGTFQFRAQGAMKSYGPTPGEVESMLTGGGQGNGTMHVTDADKVAQAAHIGAVLTPKVIDELVDAAPFENTKMREEVRDALKGRVAWMKQLADTAAAAKTVSAPAPSGVAGLGVRAGLYTPSGVTGVQHLTAEQVGTLAGKHVVVTGKLQTGTRDEIHGKIGMAGGLPQPGITSKTKLLVVGDAPGGKLKKAIELGIPVITEYELKKLVEALIEARVDARLRGLGLRRRDLVA